MNALSYRGYRFPPVIIQHAVWLYLRFTLSFRDVQELLAERGITVSHETIRILGCVTSLDAVPTLFVYGPSNQTAGSPAFGPGRLAVIDPNTSGQPELITDPGQIGALFGSTLGNLLVSGNSPEAIPVSTGLSVSLSTIVGTLDAATQAAPGTDLAPLIANAAKSLPVNVVSLGASAIVSYLTGELLNAIGISGDATPLFNIVAGVTIGQIAANEALLAMSQTTTVIAGKTVPLRAEG